MAPGQKWPKKAAEMERPVPRYVHGHFHRNFGASGKVQPKFSKDWKFQDRPLGLKFPSEIENFKRAAHQGLLKVKIEIFKRD